MSDTNIVIRYKVHFHASERGWVSDDWNIFFDTEEKAKNAVQETNNKNPQDHVPDYYTIANYCGPRNGIIVDNQWKELKYT
jgi:hypothetical protein